MPRIDDTEEAIYRRVGARLRERRIVLGLTQQQVADRLNVTYQQQHKYELGINRLPLAKLVKAASALSVPIGYFFDETANQSTKVAPRERMVLETARNFSALSERHQDTVAAMVRGLLPIA